MTIKFTLKSAVRKDGKQALLLRITKGREFTKWVNTHLNIDIKHWDAKQERCKKSHPASADLNRQIAKFKTKRETALAKFDAGTMTLERIRKSSLPKNKFNKNKADIIILVGSESGSTFGFANSLFKSLITANQKVFIDHLNNYTSYKNATHLLILTSTYGNGEAPINANIFLMFIIN